MTNETAPERIWVEIGVHSDRVCEHGEYGGTEYIRADAFEAAQARIAELEDALKTQIFFHAMTLTLRREHMDPEEIKDVEFRRDDARAALEGKGYPANQDSHGTDQQHERQEGTDG